MRTRPLLAAARTLILLGITAPACLMPGCAGFGLGGGPLIATSADGHASLAPSLPLGVYRPIDDNTADFYLTDIPLARLADPADRLSDISGNILHVHLFLIPKAGKTPIDATASNVAARLIVVASGAVGVYGGGGFMMPSGTPGDSSMGGNLEEASMRLVRASADFADRLGPCELKGAVSARLDEAGARDIGAKVDQLFSATKPVR